MNTQNFKNIDGVCKNSDVLEQIHDYLCEKAAAIHEDIVHSITIEVDGKAVIAEIYGGIYGHENTFDIKVISNDAEIGYCETLHSNYMEIPHFD